MSTKTIAGEPVIIERTYKASLSEIWELWTTKAGFESWWGPVGFRADVHTIEAKVGGTLHYDMAADTPEMIAEMARLGRPPSHPTTAHFTELTPQTHLVMTNVIDFIPGVETYESTITVDLAAKGDRVTMKVTLSPMHSEEMSGMQKQGFTSQLTKLDDRFT
jgi:uncharacterized protein YndB with AHSA1/START domain